MNTIHIDCETTGLEASRHGVISWAYIIDNEDNETIAMGKHMINTFKYATKVSSKALEINGFTIDEIKSFSDPKVELTDFISAVVNHNAGERLKVIAYNAKFDTDFMQALFAKYYPGTYGKLFDYKYVCPFELVKILDHLKLLTIVPNHKLPTVAKHFGIHIGVSHDAEDDVRVAREVWLRISGELKAKHE